MSQLAVRACRKCGVQAYLRGAAHSLGLGWWGVFSFFITPGFVLHNLVMIPRVLLTTRPGKFAHKVLEEEREYARRLLATKDLSTVVDVLVSRTGLDENDVSEFLMTVSADEKSDPES